MSWERSIVLNRLLPALLLFIIAALPGGVDAAPLDLDELLSRSVEAYGGVNRLKSLTSLRLSGRITVAGQAQPGRFERLFQAPDKLGSLISHAQGSERRILIRDQAWRNGKSASVPEHLAMGLQLARQRLPLLLVENRATIIDHGMQEQAGRRFRSLTLELAEGVSLFVILDPDSGFILQTVGKLSLADGTNADFTTLYGDYRKIEGLAIATREDHYSQGRLTGTSVIEQVEINRPLPTNAFTP